MNHWLRVLSISLSLALTSPIAGFGASADAVRVLGQPDFHSFMANRLDARGLAGPWGIAIDHSRNPNGLWVVDAGNNRVLGWRDVTRVHEGVPADVVIGQPDAFTDSCNTGGVSASSLCFAESPTYSFSYQPGLAVDGEGNLYVADQFNYRVLGYRRPFETDGVADVVIGQSRFDQAELPWGREGIAGLVFDPHGLATDGQGNLYISDRIRVMELDRPFATDAVADRVFGQSRVDAFDSDWDPAAPDRFVQVDGIAIDAMGRLYVADSWMDRVMVWTQPLARQGAADLIFAQSDKACGDPDPCYNVKGIAVAPNGDVWVGSHEQGRVFGYRSPVQTGDTEPDQVLVASNSAHVYDPKSPHNTQPVFASGGLAVDSTGTLWLVDLDRVLGFSDPWNHQTGRADRLLGQVRGDQIKPNLVDGDGFRPPTASPSTPAPFRRTSTSSMSANHRVLGWADAESFANGQSADLVLGQPDRWASGCNTGGLSLSSLCLGNRFNGLAVDSQGTVWISDQLNARVVGYRSPFTTDTLGDRVLGGIGCVTGPRGLCIPGGLAVDKAGNLYVADIGNNRILEFNQPSRRDAVADRVLGARSFRLSTSNDPATFFSEENGTHPGLNIDGGLLAVDANGRLLVGNGYVYVFDQPLQPRAHSRRLIDLSGTNGIYGPPSGLATDSGSRIYLTAGDQAGNHVYRFSRDGSGPSLQLGEPCAIGSSTGLPEGLGRSTLCAPTGLALGLRDELFVSDGFTNRVLVFENP